MCIFVLDIYIDIYIVIYIVICIDTYIVICRCYIGPYIKVPAPRRTSVVEGCDSEPHAEGQNNKAFLYRFITVLTPRAKTIKHFCIDL